MKIILLDKATINKIAAGEVIERPESVVKELVENAIDAGATSISIEISGGGIDFIKVSDNGIGIEKDDIRNAFVKHATSKIKTIEDIFAVESLGFRGEALSSIAAVAKVELATRQKDDISGFIYGIDGGAEVRFDEAGIPEGTTITVRDLFYNTPVRKKFLRSEKTEAAAVNTLIEHLALSRPDISFRFVSNGKEKLTVSGGGDIREVIYKIYGKNVTDNLIEINECNEQIGVSISGYVGKPAISRGNRTFENYSINGRYIKNDSISEAIEEAYKGYIMLHNYPFTALILKINPELLDVNVHPAKKEFRLSCADEVCSFIRKTIYQAITKSDIIPDVVPDMDTDTDTDMKTGEVLESSTKNDSDINNNDVVLKDKKPSDKYQNEYQNDLDNNINILNNKTNSYNNFENNVFESNTLKKEPFNEYSGSESFLESKENEIYDSEIKDNKIKESDDYKNKAKTPLFVQNDISGVKDMPHFRLLGHLFATYWLIESDDTFYMMDQHAAHEKILYERLMKRHLQKNPQTQYLTVPVMVTVDPQTIELMEEDDRLFEALRNIGYDAEIFGDNTIKVTGIPAGLPTMNYEQMITDTIDGFAAKAYNGTDIKDSPQIMVEKLASMSCKAAIKGNDRISPSEALALLKEMMEADNPYNCPHGRPTLIAMSKYEIEKKFKRIT